MSRNGQAYEAIVRLDVCGGANKATVEHFIYVTLGSALQGYHTISSKRWLQQLSPVSTHVKPALVICLWELWGAPSSGARGLL